MLASSRLGTVVGPGGAGKTRLATEVARQWQRQGHGPVWMVELAPVTDPANVLPALLGALDLREARILDRPRGCVAARRPRAARRRRSTAQPILLVVDNCEHLVDAAARLAEQLLAGVPAPSGAGHQPRAARPGRRVALPAAAARPAAVGRTVADAPGYPAVRLFLDRAAAARPGFVVDQHLAPVVEICRRLDGLPLAIELAAARLRTLPVAEVASRLGDRFRLLTGGSRTALPRHQTLRAVVEWSWDLLHRRRAPARRAAGGLPGRRDAARARPAICGDDRLWPPTCRPAGHPGRQVAARGRGDGPSLRYRMLETIREYGVDRLAERGEAEGGPAAARAVVRRPVPRAVRPARTARASWRRRPSWTPSGRTSSPRCAFSATPASAAAALRLALELSWYWVVLDNDIGRVSMADVRADAAAARATPATGRSPTATVADRRGA